MLARLLSAACAMINSIRFLFDGKLRLHKIPLWEPPAVGMVHHPMHESVKRALAYPLGGVSVLWGPSGSGKNTMAVWAATEHASEGHYVAVLVSSS